ncbi:MAG: DUF4434 domain-containing protein [Candidatus Electrothrix sp. AR5]|nr:DUF4434 domain-containing protein [Candidatus Electrothrix sp. AR5]
MSMPTEANNNTENLQNAITGIFDAGWNSFFRTQEKWDQQMRNLTDLGCDTLVLQYSLKVQEVATGIDTSSFYPSLLTWTSDWGSTGSKQENCIPRALEAAVRQGIDVYIGLYYEDKGWWTSSDESYLTRQKDRCIAVFKELENLYGNNSCVKGYYLPHEIARYYWKKPADRKRLTSNFLKPLTTFLHSESNKKLMVSPFFNHELESPTELRDFWQELLKDWTPDIIVPQDGIGAKHATVDDVGSYLEAIQQAVVAEKIDFWVNIELFKESGTGLPATILRVKKQLSAVPTGTKKIIAYDYATITDDHYGHEMNELFEELKGLNFRE